MPAPALIAFPPPAIRHNEPQSSSPVRNAPALPQCRQWPETSQGRNCRPRRRSSRIGPPAAERPCTLGGRRTGRGVPPDLRGGAWPLTGQGRPTGPQPRRLRRRARGPRRCRRPDPRPVRPGGSRCNQRADGRSDRKVGSHRPVGACRPVKHVSPGRRLVSSHSAILTRSRPRDDGRRLGGSPRSRVERLRPSVPGA